MSDKNTTNIMDCINKGPVWINSNDWNQIIKDIWFILEFQRRSKSAKNNQLTETNGKLRTHSGGTVSFASYRASMISIFLFVIMDFKFLYLYFLIFFLVDSKKKQVEKNLYEMMYFRCCIRVQSNLKP
jgi:hypothetical protein